MLPEALDPVGNGAGTSAGAAGFRPALMDTYARWPVAFARGEGSWLFTGSGEPYLDLAGGIAVTVLGHAHPAVTRAVARQAASLIHCSNLYEIPLQEALAVRLAGLTGLARAFFCNSGAEANEAAIKLARRHAWIQGGPARLMIITLSGSFHGRTLGALSATAQPRYQEGFGPLVPGFTSVPPGDLDALAAALRRHRGETCAVMLEPVLGEGGVVPLDFRYLKGVQDLCRQDGILLIADEVQTGMGRTGSFLASQSAGIQPDVVTLAKGLANGVPIGAVLASEAVAAGFVPGSHGSTFGGNPLACAAALATLDVIESEALPGRAVHLGEQLEAGLRRLAAEHPAIARTVRGAGLMLALEVDVPASEVVAACLEERLLVTSAGPRTVRFLPALTLLPSEAEEGLLRLGRALSRLKRGLPVTKSEPGDGQGVEANARRPAVGGR